MTGILVVPALAETLNIFVSPCSASVTSGERGMTAPIFAKLFLASR